MLLLPLLLVSAGVFDGRETNCAAASCCSNAAGGCCDGDGVTPCGGNSCNEGLCKARACATCPPPPPTPAPSPPSPPWTCTGKSAQLRAADCAGWALFFNRTAGGGWGACADALSDPCACGAAATHTPPPAAAPGAAARVVCSKDASGSLAITEVHLRGTGLTGLLAAALEALGAMALEGLRTLDLGDNALSGPLPAGPILNTDVSYLSLGGNPLGGGVPAACLSGLTDLRFLNLSHCGLRGATLPDALYSLTDIVTLDLSHNGFEGPVCSSSATPETCWATACTTMTHADLSHNSFSGPLPLFTKSGTITPWVPATDCGAPCGDGALCCRDPAQGGGGCYKVGDCSAVHDSSGGRCLRWNMETMNYAHNDFSGSIPDALALLGAPVSSLNLEGNQLSGTVPASLKLLPLTALRLDGNQLTGTVPPLPFANYTGACDLKGNAFTCPLPPGAAKCLATCAR